MILAIWVYFSGPSRIVTLTSPLLTWRSLTAEWGRNVTRDMVVHWQHLDTLKAMPHVTVEFSYYNDPSFDKFQNKKILNYAIFISRRTALNVEDPFGCLNHYTAPNSKYTVGECPSRIHMRWVPPPAHPHPHPYMSWVPTTTTSIHHHPREHFFVILEI